MLTYAEQSVDCYQWIKGKKEFLRERGQKKKRNNGNHLKKKTSDYIFEENRLAGIQLRGEAVLERLTKGSEAMISFVYGFSKIPKSLVVEHTAGCFCHVSASLVKSGLRHGLHQNVPSLTAASRLPLLKLCSLEHSLRTTDTVCTVLKKALLIWGF